MMDTVLRWKGWKTCAHLEQVSIDLKSPCSVLEVVVLVSDLHCNVMMEIGVVMRLQSVTIGNDRCHLDLCLFTASKIESTFCYNLSTGDD